MQAYSLPLRDMVRHPGILLHDSVSSIDHTVAFNRQVKMCAGSEAVGHTWRP